MKKKNSGSKHIAPSSGKVGSGMGHGGGNLKLAVPSHAVHVEAKKDKMAHNVSNHLNNNGDNIFGDNHDQDDDLIETGADMKKPKKVHNPY